MIRARRLLPVMVSLILAAFSPVVHAAHSRRARVTVRSTASPRYDRSITTFDQTGRLLQVEYGMEAANRGEAVVAVWTEAKIYVFVRNSSSQKVHRLDENIFLFSAGLSGDARALASSLRSSCQQHRLSYGEAPTVEQAARHAASLQHQLTRTGGARPLGCTAIVVGIDLSSSATAASGESRVFRSDPGGILEDCLYCAAGKDNDKLMNQVAKQYDGFKAANQTDIVTQVLSSMNALDQDSSVDVWIIEPSAKRRGQTFARCLRNVQSHDMKRVAALLESEEEPVT